MKKLKLLDNTEVNYDDSFIVFCNTTYEKYFLYVLGEDNITHLYEVSDDEYNEKLIEEENPLELTFENELELDSTILYTQLRAIEENKTVGQFLDLE